MSLTVGTGQERPEVELELDGLVQDRPRTPWSEPGWFARG